MAAMMFEVNMTVTIQIMIYGEEEEEEEKKKEEKEEINMIST